MATEDFLVAYPYWEAFLAAVLHIFTLWRFVKLLYTDLSMQNCMLDYDCQMGGTVVRDGETSGCTAKNASNWNEKTHRYNTCGKCNNIYTQCAAYTYRLLLLLNVTHFCLSLCLSCIAYSVIINCTKTYGVFMFIKAPWKGKYEKVCLQKICRTPAIR